MILNIRGGESETMHASTVHDVIDGNTTKYNASESYERKKCDQEEKNTRGKTNMYEFYIGENDENCIWPVKYCVIHF